MDYTEKFSCYSLKLTAINIRNNFLLLGSIRYLPYIYEALDIQYDCDKRKYPLIYRWKLHFKICYKYIYSKLVKHALLLLEIIYDKFGINSASHNQKRKAKLFN